MEKFSDFNLPDVLANSLERMKFTTPTPIQAQAIPPALEGRDVLGSAQTGTGKTASFMIPLVTHLLNNKDAQGLVMAPTRELAMQVLTMTKELLGAKSNIRTALLIGGDPMFKQFKQLGENPRLIIGTPGRINDHIRRKKSLLKNTDFLVLDEADRMLDMGFSIQIDEVIKNMAEERQTLMFSATFSKEIINFTKRYLKNPVRVEISPEKVSADKIKHDVVKTTSAEKFKKLTEELSQRDGSIIIFVKTRVNADQIATRLCNVKDEDFQAEPIHGDLRQRQRERTIQGFRNKKFRILVATDVAARGLDIPHIEHVINYDLPQSPEDYVHRIGRTARAGAEGNAMAFVTPQDNSKWYAILRLVFPEQAAAEKKSRPELSKTKSRMRRRSERDRDFSKEIARYDDDASNGVKPLFSSRRNDSKRNEDGSKNRWSKNRFEKRDEGRASGPKRFGQKRAESRFEEKSERNFNDRSEKRSEGRSEGRFEGRRERSSEDRFEKRSEGRFERSGNRSEGRRSEGRSERNSDGGRFEKRRPDRSERSEGRSEKRFGEKKFSSRSEGRSEGRSERKFSDRSERSYEGKRERNFNDPSDGRGRRSSSSEGRSERPARSGNRSDRPARSSESERRYGSYSKDRSEGNRSGGKFFKSKKDNQSSDRPSAKEFEEKRDYVKRKRAS